MLWADQSLSRRLENTEAQANVAFVEARATDATWIEVAGTFAMYDGPESPCTQTFCLGQTQPVTHEALEQIEAFFTERNAPTFHEVSPIADPSTLTILNERGYHPIELTTVLYREPGHATSVASHVTEPNQLPRWAEAAKAGWGAEDDWFLDLAKTMAQRRGATSFHVEQDGQFVATANLVIHERVALLTGASTIPAARRQGHQQALVEHRLHYAAQQNCDLAMMCALPGSESQRNAERNGFRIAYTRIKWRKP